MAQTTYSVNTFLLLKIKYRADVKVKSKAVVTLPSLSTCPFVGLPIPTTHAVRKQTLNTKSTAVLPCPSL